MITLSNWGAEHLGLDEIIMDPYQGHDLGGNGNLVPVEPVGVAPAVPALVVPAADVVGHLYQGVVLVGATSWNSATARAASMSSMSVR